MSYPFIDLKKQYKTLETDLKAAIDEVLTTGQYINGPQVGELEEALAAYTKVTEVIACSSGTSALELILMALEVGPGDVVFCPSFTFIATAEVILLRGARPMFVDIDPQTYNLDPLDLEIKIEEVKAQGLLQPKVIMAVDLFGLPADYEAIEAIATKYNLTLLEDGAQGFGGSLGNRRVGAFGQAGTTSFFPAKPLGCYGDGGAIFTNDSTIAQTIRSMRTHGASENKYEHVRLGTNSRLDTIQAAILLVKLRAFPQELERRQQVAAQYTQRLSGHLTTPLIPKDYQSAWAQYTVQVPATKREQIMATLKDHGIPTMIYYPQPLHLQPIFVNLLGGQPGDLPVAEKAATTVLSLPIHPYLDEQAIDTITKRLLDCL